MFENKELISIENEVSQAARTGRSIEMYRKYFGIWPEQMRGMNVLDVGAGDSNFADVANLFGANVTRLDARYSQTLPIGSSPAVTAIAQAMPFADNTFDLTVASFSLYWVATCLDKSITEMVRVTKENGHAMIFPVLPNGSDNSLRKISKAIKIHNPESAMAKTISIKKNPTYSLEKWRDIANKLTDACDFNSYYSPDAQHNLRLLKPFQPETIKY